MDEVERRTEGQGGVHSERGPLALGWPCVAHGRPAEPYSTVLWLENSLLALRAVGRVKCFYNRNGSKWALPDVELWFLENAIDFLPHHSPQTMFEPELYNQSNV